MTTLTKASATDPTPKCDFVWQPGVTFEKTVQFLDENEDPIDLTSYTAALEIRDYPGGTVLFRFDTTPSATEGTITVTAGTGTITLTAADTLTDNPTPWDVAVYDLLLKDSTNKIWKWLEGRVFWQKQVTVTVP